MHQISRDDWFLRCMFLRKQRLGIWVVLVTLGVGSWCIATILLNDPRAFANELPYSKFLTMLEVVPNHPGRHLHIGELGVSTWGIRGYELRCLRKRKDSLGRSILLFRLTTPQGWIGNSSEVGNRYTVIPDADVPEISRRLGLWKPRCCGITDITSVVVVLFWVLVSLSVFAWRRQLAAPLRSVFGYIERSSGAVLKRSSNAVIATIMIVLLSALGFCFGNL